MWKAFPTQAVVAIVSVNAHMHKKTASYFLQKRLRRFSRKHGKLAFANKLPSARNIGRI